MCSGNQSSFSNSLDCSPLCDGPHPEGKPSIRSPVINRGGEFRSWHPARAKPNRRHPCGWQGGPPMLAVDCSTLLTGRGETIAQRFSFSKIADGSRITATLTLSKQNLHVSNDNMLEGKKKKKDLIMFEWRRLFSVNVFKGNTPDSGFTSMPIHSFLMWL